MRHHPPKTPPRQRSLILVSKFSASPPRRSFSSLIKDAMNKACITNIQRKRASITSSISTPQAMRPRQGFKTSLRYIKASQLSPSKRYAQKARRRERVILGERSKASRRPNSEADSVTSLPTLGSLSLLQLFPIPRPRSLATPESKPPTITLDSNGSAQSPKSLPLPPSPSPTRAQVVSSRTAPEISRSKSPYARVESQHVLPGSISESPPGLPVQSVRRSSWRFSLDTESSCSHYEDEEAYGGIAKYEVEEEVTSTTTNESHSRNAPIEIRITSNDSFSDPRSDNSAPHFSPNGQVLSPKNIESSPNGDSTNGTPSSGRAAEGEAQKFTALLDEIHYSRPKTIFEEEEVSSIIMTASISRSLRDGKYSPGRVGSFRTEDVEWSGTTVEKALKSNSSMLLKPLPPAPISALSITQSISALSLRKAKSLQSLPSERTLPSVPSKQEVLGTFPPVRPPRNPARMPHVADTVDEVMLQNPDAPEVPAMPSTPTTRKTSKNFIASFFKNLRIGAPREKGKDQVVVHDDVPRSNTSEGTKGKARPPPLKIVPAEELSTYEVIQGYFDDPFARRLPPQIESVSRKASLSSEAQFEAQPPVPFVSETLVVPSSPKNFHLPSRLTDPSLFPARSPTLSDISTTSGATTLVNRSPLSGLFTLDSPADMMKEREPVALPPVMPLYRHPEIASEPDLSDSSIKNRRRAESETRWANFLLAASVDVKDGLPDIDRDRENGRRNVSADHQLSDAAMAAVRKQRRQFSTLDLCFD